MVLSLIIWETGSLSGFLLNQGFSAQAAHQNRTENLKKYAPLLGPHLAAEVSSWGLGLASKVLHPGDLTRSQG